MLKICHLRGQKDYWLKKPKIKNQILTLQLIIKSQLVLFLQHLNKEKILELKELKEQ